MTTELDIAYSLLFVGILTAFLALIYFLSDLINKIKNFHPIVFIMFYYPTVIMAAFFLSWLITLKLMDFIPEWFKYANNYLNFIVYWLILTPLLIVYFSYIHYLTKVKMKGIRKKNNEFF